MARARQRDGPLNEAELDRLDEILLNRIDADTDTRGKNEGLLGLSEVDGFLTAIVSGPSAIVPSRWLATLWGDFEPVWKNVADYQEFLALLIRHMNSNADTLTYEPAAFEPIFMENRAVDPPAIVVDEWCEGYVCGVNLAGDEWATAGADIETLLAPILAFTDATLWSGHGLAAAAIADALRAAIAPNARAIHAYWLARRPQHAAAGAPGADLAQSQSQSRPVSLSLSPVRAAPRVGRNDPCLCGSGKKYKKCCLQ